jgi:DnaD/phage-associated family protein
MNKYIRFVDILLLQGSTLKMIFESVNSILYSDTLISDIFITEYLPSLSGDHIKVYTYLVFLTKNNKQSTIKNLAVKLEIEYNKTREILSSLEELKLIRRHENKVYILDLKEQEIKKMYRPLLSGTPENADANEKRNKKRIQTVRAINNAFFSGLMSPSWYLDIDLWFERFKFEEDVMYSLFQHCYDNNKLNKNYIVRVAEDWHLQKIKNGHELDDYFRKYQKLKAYQKTIYRKLKRKSSFTEFEEKIMSRWIFEYGFSQEIINKALEKTTSISEPNFNYINAILKKWYDNSLKTIEEIENWEKKCIQQKRQNYRYEKAGNYRESKRKRI